jgi:hypothetical protein
MDKPKQEPNVYISQELVNDISFVINLLRVVAKSPTAILPNDVTMHFQEAIKNVEASDVDNVFVWKK